MGIIYTTAQRNTQLRLLGHYGDLEGFAQSTRFVLDRLLGGIWIDLLVGTGRRYSRTLGEKI